MAYLHVGECVNEAGGHFGELVCSSDLNIAGPHYDGPFVESSERRSLKTFNLYLNGGFERGSTNFIDESQSLLYDNTTGMFKAEQNKVLQKVIPEGGMVLIFNHHILHEGVQDLLSILTLN